MSCVRACVGSFGVITRVCQMGGGRSLSSPSVTEPQNRWISLGGRWRRYPPFLVKYWFLARRPFYEKCSFFPYCYGQFSVIVCALFASAPSKKTIARVTRIGKNCRILFDILTPDRLYSSWTSLPLLTFLLKYLFLARRPFCEKCSFFPIVMVNFR